jgi:hypothetical protein
LKPEAGFLSLTSVMTASAVFAARGTPTPSGSY